MDDWGKIEWFLGMQINEDSGRITLDQERYIESVSEKFSMQDNNLSKTAAENNFKLMEATEVEQLVDATLYRSLVGSLLYIADSCTNQRFPNGWLANACSAIYKPENHSNSCTQETVTTI